jgi:hypothetical protein
MDLEEKEARNDYAGEDQQQFNNPTSDRQMSQFLDYGYNGQRR